MATLKPSVKTSILSTIKSEEDLYEITSDPRKSKETTAELVNKAGGKEAFTQNGILLLMVIKMLILTT